MIRLRKRLFRAVVAVVAFAGLAWLSGIRLFAFAGESMSPAVQPGDHLVGLVGAWGLRAPKRFDMAIFDVPSTSKWAGLKIPWMKRLVGLPGEHIRLSGAQLFVDGRKVEAPFLHSERMKDFEVRLGEREYFVLGDNLDWTLQDSRAMGPIPSSLMRGFVLLVLHTSPQTPNKAPKPTSRSVTPRAVRPEIEMKRPNENRTEARVARARAVA